MSRLPVDTDVIRILAEILAETGLTEIEISEKDTRVRVARVATAAPAAPAYAALPAAAPLPLAPPAPPSAPQAAQGSAAPAPADLAAHPGAVTSPMVGIAYLTPEPGAAPFVAVGQTVTAGQTILLIEAMKTFNQIKAPKAGKLSAVLVSSGSPVEFGEVLAVID